MPDFLLISDSKKSPKIPINEIISPTKIILNKPMFISKYENSRYEEIIEDIIPANVPSKVLFGLTLGKLSFVQSFYRLDRPLYH